MLTKEEILGFSGLKVESVEAFGGTVYVREMNGIQRDRMANMFSESMNDGVNRLPEGYKIKVALWCICDESGNRLFDDSDLDQLQNQPIDEIDKVADKAMSLSKIEEDEDAEGN